MHFHCNVCLFVYMCVCAYCAADRLLSATNDPVGVVNVKQRRKLNKKQKRKQKSKCKNCAEKLQLIFRPLKKKQENNNNNTNTDIQVCVLKK